MLFAPLGAMLILWALGRIHRGWVSSLRCRESRGILCNAPGRIARFSVGGLGNVKGFLLDTGVFATTPPEVGATLVASIPPQAKVLVSGYFRQSRSGETVIDAVLIIVDGQHDGNQSDSRPYSRIFS
jgi:hypothetical protein